MARRTLPLLATAILALTGCFESEESEGTLTFRFATWVLLIPASFGVAALVLGAGALFIRGKGRMLSLIPFGVAALALGIFLPSMYCDRVVVSPTEIRQTTGFWFSPMRKGFRYDEVRAIRRKTVYTAKGVPNEKWMIRYTDGNLETLDPGDLWEHNGDVIIPRLRESGVDIR